MRKGSILAEKRGNFELVNSDFFKLVKSGLSFTKLSGIGLYENTVVTGCPIKGHFRGKKHIEGKETNT